MDDANDIEQLVELLRTHVLERHYGKYRGFVADNEDPRDLGRIKATVPAVLGEESTGWALPCMPWGGSSDQGMYTVPEEGAGVWVEFEGGDVSRPIWTGTFWGKSQGNWEHDESTGSGNETPKRVDGDTPKPAQKVLRSGSGHTLEFEDDGKKRLRLRHADGHGVDLNGGEEALVEAKKILLGSLQSREALILGNAFMKLFNQHTHPTGVGPSGPPTPPMTTAHLSSKTKTE
ncbi:MAG: phage baseplate assembly protein V [Myxococcota bacterium]